MRALTYLSNVKNAFPDDEEKYEEFLYVVMDFLTQRIDLMGLRERVIELFRGHTDLLLGFNHFLPKDYEISMEDAQPPQIIKKATATSEALAYICSVWDRLRDEKKKFGQFMDLIRDYGNQGIDVVGVREKMKELLEGHTDLLLGFNVFLPKECEITLPCENEQAQENL